jgi:hypothetical protein
VPVTSERISADVQAARDLLAPPMPDDPQDLIARLSEAAQRVQSALDEAMAVAALDGFSMRAIALPAKVAPNSVPPRLARSAALADYAEAGKVTAEGVTVARADRDRGTPPLRFVPRKRIAREPERGPDRTTKGEPQ